MNKFEGFDRKNQKTQCNQNQETKLTNEFLSVLSRQYLRLVRKDVFVFLNREADLEQTYRAKVR
jgi:hypothetical protein